MLFRKISGLLALAIAVVLFMGNVPAQAADQKTVTVSTESELKSAMKNKKVKKIIFRTDEEDYFDIPKIKGSEKKKLEIDASDACFDNEATFKSITLIDADCFIEHGRNNTITSKDDDARINIGSDIKKLTLKGKGSDVVIDGAVAESIICARKNAKVILNVYFNASANVTLAKKTELRAGGGNDEKNIKITSEAKGSRIAADSPIEINAAEDTQVTLYYYAWDSVVSQCSKTAKVTVKKYYSDEDTSEPEDADEAAEPEDVDEAAEPVRADDTPEQTPEQTQYAVMKLDLGTKIYITSPLINEESGTGFAPTVVYTEWEDMLGDSNTGFKTTYTSLRDKDGNHIKIMPNGKINPSYEFAVNGIANNRHSVSVAELDGVDASQLEWSDISGIEVEYVLDWYMTAPTSALFGAGDEDIFLNEEYMGKITQLSEDSWITAKADYDRYEYTLIYKMSPAEAKQISYATENVAEGQEFLRTHKVYELCVVRDKDFKEISEDDLKEIAGYACPRILGIELGDIYPVIYEEMDVTKAIQHDPDCFCAYLRNEIASDLRIICLFEDEHGLDRLSLLEDFIVVASEDLYPYFKDLGWELIGNARHNIMGEKFMGYAFIIYTDEVRQWELYNQIAEKLYTGEYEK